MTMEHTTKCDRAGCLDKPYVRMSWTTSIGRQTSTICQEHARELSNQLRPFPAHETLTCEAV